MPIKKDDKQQEHTINTGGGAYVGRNVYIDGGDFVGKDKIVINGDINNTTILEQPTACYICGKLCYRNDSYFCKRCQQNVCLEHQKESKAPICPNCLVSIKMDCDDMLFDLDGEKRIEAAKILCVLKDLSMLPTLKHCLEVEESEYVRHWLAYAIGQTGGKKAYEILKEAESRENNLFALMGIQNALEEIKVSEQFKT